MKSEVIQYINIKELTPPELDLLNKLSGEYYDKIKRTLQNITGLHIHVKSYGHEGKRKKYDVHIQVHTPSKNRYASTKAHDWDFARTIHKAFGDIQAQIEHSIHKRDQRAGKHAAGHFPNARLHSYGRASRTKTL